MHEKSQMHTIWRLKKLGKPLSQIVFLFGYIISNCLQFTCANKTNNQNIIGLLIIPNVASHMK